LDDESTSTNGGAQRRERRTLIESNTVDMVAGLKGGEDDEGFKVFERSNDESKKGRAGGADASVYLIV
jgi:hypothetical protein